ncbi:MAG: hypothetical protein GY757_38795 [bacterium]|nr:hypothetical protein [bacterium]
MRCFSSYGPVNSKLHYYAQREDLIEKGLYQLLGENVNAGGHYFTVWAPRQCGKTWTMQQVLFRLQKDERFDVLKINLEILKDRKEVGDILAIIARKIGESLGKKFTGIDTQDKFQEIFSKNILNKPLILILDEFDAMPDEGIAAVVSAFRNIYIKRMDEVNKPAEKKSYLLHSIALIGIRSILGIENETGSSFNIQRSLHVSNLTYDEVEGMFHWYEKESGQKIEPDVIKKIYDDTRGQPGLTCWLGELLTETYNENKKETISMEAHERMMEKAINLLPNSNILNIISKAKQDPHKDKVLKMFRADKLFPFRFDDKSTNFLYLNGLIEPVEIRKKNFIKFANPFVQKRVFNYFASELFSDLDRLVEPMDTLEDAISDKGLSVKNIMKRYKHYLAKNKDWLFKDAPRRKNLRIYEAVYHFNLYMYLYELIVNRGGNVFPEFPTGNGKIDLLIDYNNKRYGLELKTYSDAGLYKKALSKAADYGKQLKLKEINLIFFIEAIDEENKKKYEAQYLDKTTGVTVIPIFVSTGNGGNS